MKTIALISQKGGSGKTTIANALAVQSCLEGLKTLLIDIDPQGSSYNWGERRLAAELTAPAVVSAHAIALERLLNGAREQNVDLVIIDTAPKSEKDARKAAELADLVLIPCRPSIHDMDAIEHTVETCRLAKTPAFVLLNSVHPNAPRQAEDVTLALKQAYDPIQVLAGFYLAARSEHVHSAATGLTAAESEPDGKAAAEIRTLFEMLDGLIGIYPKQESKISI